MDFVSNHVERFKELFKGNPNAYGEHLPDPNPVEGQKAKGKSYTKRKPIKLDHYLKHLHGEMSLGIPPLMPDNKVRFMAIDVDVYPLDPHKYINICKRARLPLVPFRSKSGGLHLYLFFSEDVLCDKAMPLIQNMRQILGLKPDCEVFPKQTRLFGESVGNWINIPYQNNKQTARYAYDSAGQQMDIESAIDLCFSKRVGFKELSDLMETVPLAQGPPCIQTIYLEGGTDKGERNAFLFNCCVYLKARFKDDYATNMHKLNASLNEPIEYERLDTTVIASHNKKDYTYQCKNSVLTGYCDKEICKLRPYGINSGDVSDLSFGDLTQFRGSKPYYIWVVNDEEMMFSSEAELMSQQRFGELCFRLLHTVPKKMTVDTWNSKLNRALENVIVEEIDEADELSSESLWMDKLAEFLNLSRAVRKIQVNDGMCWYNPKNKSLNFKGSKLFGFITKDNQFRDYSDANHREALKKVGGTATKLQENGTQLRVWKINIPRAHKRGYLLDVAIEEVDKQVMEEIEFNTNANSGGKF